MICQYCPNIKMLETTKLIKRSFPHFRISIFFKTLVQFSFISFIESADVDIENYVVFDIILVIIIVNPQFESIFEYIFKALAVHLEYIYLFFAFLYLFLIDVALVHESVLVLLLHLFFLEGHLIYLD